MQYVAFGKHATASRSVCPLPRSCSQALCKLWPRIQGNPSSAVSIGIDGTAVKIKYGIPLFCYTSKKNIFTCKIFCRNHDYRAEHIPSFDKLEVKIVRNTWGKERGAGMKQKPKLCPLVLQKRNASSNIQLVLFWFVFNQKANQNKGWILVFWGESPWKMAKGPRETQKYVHFAPVFFKKQLRQISRRGPFYSMLCNSYEIHRNGATQWDI